ncbi:MAG TPA: DUF3857 domain-containing protein [Pyrinomonadaceae bacterium]|nr:DUF3857 domain-containing protein [Pyrinomonadaceae bacterium]
MLKRLIGCTFFLLLLSVPALAGSDEAPLWLRDAAAQNAPAYDRQVRAVVLRREQNVTVSEDGHIVTTTLYAVRLLTREGREYARAIVPYLTETGKVRELNAWLIRPGGAVKHYGSDNVTDAISDPNDVYNELRVKVISAASDADAGMVFGYQSVTEERSVFGYDDWNFQDRLPTLAARYTVNLPSGWSAQSVTFNHSKVEPAVSGTSYSWELDNLPPIAEEPASPEVTNLAPRLAVSYVPAQGANTPLKTFSNWVDVSRWLSELHDPQAASNDALIAKARELTANSHTELERIQAIGRYVQHLQYISIDIGVGRGGGLRPHAATEVFAKSYGDCKDKANLMRAMLKAVGITAYTMAIYLGDPTYVREEWASPSQFNHCIVAIKVGDETQAATVVQHPKLGRLLIFDATDDATPVGDLPQEEQNSLALLIAGDQGALLRMPVTPPESNRLERQAEMTLNGDGSMSASVHERFAGQSAVSARREFRALSRPQYNQRIEEWITHGVQGARLSRIEPTDQINENRFALDVDFNSLAYAQLMQNRLLIFKPAIVSRHDSLVLTEASRRQPVVLGPYALTETVRVHLPANFDVDELPDPLKLDAPFGSYAASYEVKGDQLVFTRTMTLRAATIPPEQYATVRGFFERILATEQAPVVLARR